MWEGMQPSNDIGLPYFDCQRCYTTMLLKFRPSTHRMLSKQRHLQRRHNISNRGGAQVPELSPADGDLLSEGQGNHGYDMCAHGTGATTST